MVRASADRLAVSHKCVSPRPYRESAPSEPRTTFPSVPCSKVCPCDGNTMVPPEYTVPSLRLREQGEQGAEMKKKGNGKVFEFKAYRCPASHDEPHSYGD